MGEMFLGIKAFAVFVAYITAANIGTFIMFGIDKSRKKKGKKRINEDLMLFLCMLLASVGGLLGMIVFHNKTRKKKFRIGLPVITLAEWGLYALLVLTGAINWA